MRRVSTRALVISGILVALVVAGLLSYYASSSPDGLEHVARSEGFDQTAEDHAVEDGPLADYSVKGVDDARLSGGLAGVVGCMVVLVLAGGLAFVVRRPRDRSRDRSGDRSGPEQSR